MPSFGKPTVVSNVYKLLRPSVMQIIVGFQEVTLREGVVLYHSCSQSPLGKLPTRLCSDSFLSCRNASHAEIGIFINQNLQWQWHEWLDSLSTGGDQLVHWQSMLQMVTPGGGHCRKLLIKLRHLIKLPPLTKVHDVTHSTDFHLIQIIVISAGSLAHLVISG
jgi:hypothetical protein